MFVNCNLIFILFLLNSQQALTALLADDNKFGFIVMDGNGALFGTLSGNTRDVMHKFSVDLPKKHGKVFFKWTLCNEFSLVLRRSSYAYLPF